MGKLGKETKNLLLAITVICLISFLLAAGLSFLLAKDFQHEMLLHDYGVSGYQLNHEDKLQISAFTAHPNESDLHCAGGFPGCSHVWTGRYVFEKHDG